MEPDSIARSSLNSPEDISTAVVMYDGKCAMCHSFIRFVVYRDRKNLFRFAPRGGQTYDQLISPSERALYPDSILLLRPDRTVLARSNATIEILKQLGSVWKALAILLSIVPRPIRDFGYRIVASLRKKLFKEPQGLCPVVPPEMRGKFLV